MSDNTDQVEQITKVPSVAPKREKDPKRVAAGKKLAESNKIMREEHARYKAAEEVQRRNDESLRIHETPETLGTETETNQSSLSDGLLSQLSLTNVISLVGIGLTIYAIFFKKSGGTEEKHVEWKEPVETTFERTEAKQHGGTRPEPQPKTQVGPKPKTKAVETKSRPKFGM